MNKFWKTIGLWLGLATGSIAIWEKAVPLITFPSPLAEALAYAVLVSVLVWVGCNFCIGVCREVPAVYQRLYRRTKRARFVALLSRVESMIRDLPTRDKYQHVFRLPDQHRLAALVVELEQLGIAPAIEAPQGHARSYERLLQYYEALRAYLVDVHEYILRHDLKGCIKMSRGYRSAIVG